MASPCSPHPPCCPDVPSYCNPVPIIPVCTNPEYCEDVYTDKCIMHKGNYLPNLDVSEGARLDTILAKVDAKFSIVTTLRGSAALAFPGTSAGHSSELTISVPGALTGDIVQVGYTNASFLANSLFTARVSMADTVSVTYHNYSSGTLTPASGVFNVLILR